MTDSSVTGRNQNHSDIRDESARDNDPLFELSRIFGFEEPVNQTNMQTPQAETEISSEINLERELMADFDAEFAAEFAAEPQMPENTYEVLHGAVDGSETSDLYGQAHSVSHAAQQVVEPRFTGYAPLQRAYAENKAPAENSVVQEPAFTGQAVDHYANEPVYTNEAALSDAPSDNYYAAYSDLPHDAAFSEPQQVSNQDYFSSLESGLSHNFEENVAPEISPSQYYGMQDNGYIHPSQDDSGYIEPADSYETQPVAEQNFDLPDFDLPEFMPDNHGFEDAGREPQQEFVAQSFDNVFTSGESFSPSDNLRPQADLSLEDELAFLLHDEAPVAASVQTAQSNYMAPVLAEPVQSETDFAPLFDAPSTEVTPVVAGFDEREFTAADNSAQPDHASEYAHADPSREYAQVDPSREYAQVDDEFFAAPDLTHLPKRSASFSYEEKPVEEAPLNNSFAELFGATSQPDFADETEAVSAHPSEEETYSYNDQQTENFSFGDDFYAADESSAVEEQAFVPEPAAPVAHNAVRGYSSYTFGAATPAAASADIPLNTFTDVQNSVEYSAPADIYQPAETPESFETASDYSEQPAVVSENFFSNDDFDFSFDEDVQPVEEFSAVEEDLPEIPAYQPVQSTMQKPLVPAPEIESVIVAENKVEQTQALDLPDVSFGDDVKATGLNSLESEFAEIFSTISVSEAAAPDTTSEADKAFENILQDNFADYHASAKAEPEQAGVSDKSGGFAMAGGAVAAGALAGSANSASGRKDAQGGADAEGNASQDDYYNHWAAQGSQTNDFDTYNLSDNFSREQDEFEDARPREENPLRKPVLWASVAAAALIVLGGGYYLLKSGGVVGGEPAVLRADSQPVKMQPENPGGTIVPNQDKAVYDQVSGTKPAAPEQKNLINTEEEPVDVGLLQGQDAEEDRLLADEPVNTNTTPPVTNTTPQEGERELVTPRTVRTMVVRADGTIVQGEAPVASQEPAPTDSGLDEASRLISQSAVPERLGTDKPAASAQSAAAPRVVQTQTFTASGEQVKPREVATAPVVPSRPAEQPVNVVGNVERPSQNQAPQQVASANATVANVPAGTWFIQVASQPSAELAQKNYANLTSRYGNIIGGRGVDIKKADIAGKGTYYRVRIPGGTKAEAGALCERLKSAGGSCFPTL